MSAEAKATALAGSLCDRATALAVRSGSAADREEARRLYALALRADARHAETLFNVGVMREEDGDRAGAAEAYERCVAARPGLAAAWLNWGAVLDDLGREADAVRALEEGVRLEPGSVRGNYNLGVVLLRAGELAKAVQVAKRCVRLDGRSPAACCLLADALARSGASDKDVCAFAMRAVALAEKQSPMDAGVLLNALMLAANATEKQAGKAASDEAVALWRRAADVASATSSGATVMKLAPLMRWYSLGVEAEEAARRILDIARLAKDASGENLALAMLGVSTSGTSTMAPEELSPTCEAAALHMHLPDSSWLTHKGRMYACLADDGHEDDIVPRTTRVCTLSDVREAMARAPLGSGTKVWFLKDPGVQRGQGVRVVRDVNDLPSEWACEPGSYHVLQRGVEPLLLNGTHKFGVRVHALVVRWAPASTLPSPSPSVFVFGEGILTMCLEPYSSASTSPLVHVASTSVQRAAPGFDRDKQKGVASKRFGGYAAAVPEIERKIHATMCAVARARGREWFLLGVDADADAGVRVKGPLAQLFGFDVMFADGSGEPWLAEANASPQFQDAKRTPELVSLFAAPMLSGLARVLGGGAAMRETLAVRSRGDLSTWRWVGDLCSL